MKHLEIKTKVDIPVDDLLYSLTKSELTQLTLTIIDILEFHQLQAIQERVENKLLTETTE
jgi:hypothetical protein